MLDYIEVLDETDPRSNLDGDTLIHTDIKSLQFPLFQDQIISVEKIFLK